MKKATFYKLKEAIEVFKPYSKIERKEDGSLIITFRPNEKLIKGFEVILDKEINCYFNKEK